MQRKLYDIVFINIIILIFILFNNLDSFYIYLIDMLLILGLLWITIKKKEGLFILFSLLFLFFNINLILVLDNLLFLAVLYLNEIVLYYTFFKYVFNLHNNKMQLTFKNIQIPNNKDYLIGKYIMGLINMGGANVLLTLSEKGLVIEAEDKSGNVKKIEVEKDKIKQITIKKKPYFKTSYRLDNYEITREIAKTRGEFDAIKKFKIIKSFDIKIETTEGIINLLAFNFPDLLMNFKNVVLS